MVGVFSNVDNPTSDMYCILDQIESFRGSDGTFEFRMMWPDIGNSWTQSSNPVTTVGVVGYLPGVVTHSGFVSLRLCQHDSAHLFELCSKRTWMRILHFALPLSAVSKAPVSALLTLLLGMQGGLEMNVKGQSLIDGSIDTKHWFYTVGDYGNTTWGHDGIPGAPGMRGQGMVELAIATH